MSAGKSKPWFRTARKQWFANMNGKQVPLGISDPADVSGAEAALRAIIGALASHTPLTPSNAALTPSQTVADAVAGYLALCHRRAAAGRIQDRTVEEYRRGLEPFLAAFAGRLLSTLAAEEVEAWAARPEWSPSTQRTYLGAVMSALKWAGCALSIRRPPSESRGAETCLTDEQFALVLKELRAAPKVGDLAELLTVLRLTGARPQELASLRSEAVDWENCCTRKREHKTRRHTGADRVIHFPEVAMKVLKEQRERYGSTGPLFRTRHGKPYRQSVIVRRLGDISERVGFRVVSYGMRHAFCTRALEAGVPDAVVAALVGHKGTAMLQRHYSHVGANAQAMRAAAERATRPR